jgi:hypothetical protein
MLVLELKLFHYTFEDFQARLTMHARASLADGRELFEKNYNSVGPKQGGKMFFAGAFGMKSAVRRSSLAAFKTAFAELRSDLAQENLTSQGAGNQNPPAESRPAVGP